MSSNEQVEPRRPFTSLEMDVPMHSEADAALDNDSNAGDEQASTVSVDDVFSLHIGEFGRRQQILFCLVSLTWFPGALMTLNMAFVGKDPIEEHMWRCVDPEDALCKEAFASENPTDLFCALDRSAWTWTAPKESVVSDLNLYCERGWLMEFANSAFFFGFLFGASAWGALSDWYGRRFSLLLGVALSGLTGVVNAVTPNYTLYFIARIICGAAVAGPGMVSFTHASEIVGASWRGSIGIGTQFFWSAGNCALPGVALLFPEWRKLMAVSGISMAAMLLILVPYMPESPRWWLSQGNRSESRFVLSAIAKGNNARMTSQRLEAPAPTATQATLWDTFRVPVLRRRQFVMLIAWCVVSLSYYGVALALGDLGGNLYLNFLLVSAIEFPAYVVAIFLVNRVGRKLLTVAGFFICGSSCLVCALLPQESAGVVFALRTAAAVGGKFGGAMAFILLFVYTSELFPTVVRNVALGSNSSAARVGGVLAPLIVLVAHQMHALYLSFFIFGVATLGSGMLCLLLPETMSVPLVDTVEEVEQQAQRPHGGTRDGFQAVADDTRSEDTTSLRAALEDV